MLRRIRNRRKLKQIVIIILLLTILLMGRALQAKNQENDSAINNKANIAEIINPYDFSKTKRILTQLHCHTNLSDGSYITQQLIEKYSSLGYNALAVTDHNLINWPWQDISNNMTPIMGQEITQGYRSNSESIEQYYLRTTSNKYWHVTSYFNDYLANNYSNVQTWINEINNRNGLANIAHPNWSGLTLNDLKTINGYTGIEIYNRKCDLLAGKGYALDLWDGLLSSGRKTTWGFAVDDYHGDSNGLGYGKIIIIADGSNEQDLKAAIKKGNFYSIVGPDNILSFQSISVNNSTLSVTTNIPSSIRFIGNNGQLLKSVNNQSNADYNINGSENYIRIEANTGNNTIYSNPISIVRQTYSWQMISEGSNKDLTKLKAGDIANCTLTAKNTGNTTWTKSGNNPVRIGTWGPMDRSSAFYVAGNWLGSNRPATMNEASVAPGNNATFSFQMKAPAQTGTYFERFNLVSEGAAWMNDTGLGYYCVVSPPTYIWQFVSQGSDKDLTKIKPGETATISLTAKNTGNATWYRTGSNPVRVGTTNPRDRMSAFANGTWLGPNRPVGIPAGTDSVAPGATVTFTWTYTTPSRPGAYREYFSLVTEGITWMNDPGVNYYTVVLNYSNLQIQFKNHL